MWSVDGRADIDAAPADVWRLYADPGTWSRWGHSTARATADGPLTEGSVVTVEPTRGPTQRVRVISLEPERRIETELALPGARMRFSYEIEDLSPGCRVHHRVAMDGPLAGLFGLFMRRRNERKLADEMRRLAHEVQITT